MAELYKGKVNSPHYFLLDIHIELLKRIQLGKFIGVYFSFIHRSHDNFYYVKEQKNTQRAIEYILSL